MASGGSQRSSTTSTPWGGQSPYLSQLYERANSLFQQGPYEYYPGQTVEGFDPATQNAFGIVEQRARQGDQTFNAARGETERTLGGQYLSPDSNPHLQGIYDRGARDITRDYYGAVGSLGSRMEAAGRSGSGAHALGMSDAEENLARGLGQFRDQLYGGAYESERGRMGQAVDRAGQFAEEGYRDASALRGVGQQREHREQRVIQDLIARFEQAQRGGAERLGEFASFIGGPVMEQRGSSRGYNFSIMS
jgi:hypothetical protein